MTERPEDVSDVVVVVLEDDATLRAGLRTGLSQEGFRVRAAATAAEFVELIRREPPDLMVIDITLPDADGRDVLASARAGGVTVPALFLTARDGLSDRLAAFAAGGDDYVTKPFHLAELVARLRALAGRSVQPTRHGGVEMDPTDLSVTGELGTVTLTPTEFRVLAALLGASGTVRRRDLVRAAWPAGAMVADNTLDAYVVRVRRKLARVTEKVQVSTVHRIGYRCQG